MIEVDREPFSRASLLIKIEEHLGEHDMAAPTLDPRWCLARDLAEMLGDALDIYERILDDEANAKRVRVETLLDTVIATSSGVVWDRMIELRKDIADELG